MKILSLSHYDLDGFGCQLCIKEKFNQYDITFDNFGYQNLENFTKYNFNNYDLIFITDLNFTEDLQKLLYDKLQNYNGKFVYIDHHQYDSTKYLDLLKEKFNIIIDDSKSATLKTYEVLKLNNENLYKLCYLIDTYDTWQTERKEFKLANLFNDWFWDNTDQFIKIMKNKNYKIDNELKEELKKIHKNIKSYFEENLNKLIFQYGKVLISYDYKYSNHYQEYFDYDFAMILNIKQNRISFRDYINKKEEIKNLLKNYGEISGHKEAYGIVVNNLRENYKDIVKKVVNYLEN